MKKYIKAFIVTLLLCLVLFSQTMNICAESTVKNDDKIAERVELQISRLMEKLDIPGVAVGVVERDRVVYAKGFGVRNIKTKEPVTPYTLFDMASVSKVFTATSVMQLVEQGKIKLDSPVGEYLPYFKLKDQRYTDITIRQLITHTSGLPHGSDMNWNKPEYDDKALERFVRSLKNEKLRFEPGKKFSYSNIGFDILGDVVSKASGEDFEDYVRNHIFKPLKMNESSFYKPDFNMNVASGHVQKGTLSDYFKRLKGLIAMRNRVIGTDIEVSPVYPYNRAHVSCGTLSSNIVEMCNWMMTFLNKGTFEKTGQILSPESIEAMWRPYIMTDITAPEGLEHLVSRDKEEGLGWRLGDYRGYKTVGHGGSDVGFMTYFCLVPEKSLGIVVLCNADYMLTAQIASFLLDTLMGYDTEIEKLGKPLKAEPYDPLPLILPALCLLFMILYLFKKSNWFLLINIMVFLTANLYLIILTTVVLWVLLPADIVYLVVLCMTRRKKVF